MERISKDQYYLNIARDVLGRSTCLRRQYGAVIVKNDEIIATGYNGAPRGDKNCCDLGFCKRTAEGHAHNDGDYSSCPAVHAEANAIVSASRRDMIGATLYLCGMENGKVIDASPCPNCQGLIKNAGIARVVGSKAEKEIDYEKTKELAKDFAFLQDLKSAKEKHKPAKEMFEEMGYDILLDNEREIQLEQKGFLRIEVDKDGGDVAVSDGGRNVYLMAREALAVAQTLRELGFNEDGPREVQE